MEQVEYDQGMKIKTWEEFFTKFRRRFQMINVIQNAYDKFVDLKKQDWYGDIPLNFRIYVIMQISDINEEKTLDRLVRGLRIITKMEMRMKYPTRLKEAIKFVKNYDLFINEMTRKDIKYINHFHESWFHKKFQMDLYP